MTKKDYYKLTKGSINILESKGVYLEDKDVLSYNDCLILINLYRLIMDKQNNKIKTLKRRRDKWKSIATSEANFEEFLDANKNIESSRNKSIYKYLYNTEKEKQVRSIKLQNLKYKKEIEKLKEDILNLELELEETIDLLQSEKTKKDSSVTLDRNRNVRLLQKIT